MPVKVNVELVFAQIVTGLKAAVAVGSITVSVIVVPNNLVQLGLPEVVTLTKVTVVFTVYVPTNVAVPVAFKVIVWFAPPLIL